MLERGLTEGRTDLTLKGGTMDEYVSLLSGDHRTSGTREDEKERVNVSVAHSSNSLHVETHIQLTFEHSQTIQTRALLVILSHLYSWETSGGQTKGREVMGRD